MQLITLGIGPYPGTNDIEILVLTGLGVAETPPTPPTNAGGVITVGTIQTIAEGYTYALPPKVVNIFVYTASGTIQVSLDGTNWMTMTLSANKSFRTSAIFIRSVGGDATILAKATKVWQLN